MHKSTISNGMENHNRKNGSDYACRVVIMFNSHQSNWFEKLEFHIFSARKKTWTNVEIWCIKKIHLSGYFMGSKERMTILEIAFAVVKCKQKSISNGIATDPFDKWCVCVSSYALGGSATQRSRNSRVVIMLHHWRSGKAYTSAKENVIKNHRYGWFWDGFSIRFLRFEGVCTLCNANPSKKEPILHWTDMI